VSGRHEGIVVAEQRERDADDGEPLAASRIVDLGNILGHLVHVQEGGYGRGFLGFLVDHQRHADAAVGMASAGELAPLGGGPCIMSAQSLKVLMKLMGTSRVPARRCPPDS